uniref:GST N-terminal domain-containing protein n=1 Tax=Streptomyces sp. NBC_00049 TaxID=2903617 RepID=A0AAU2JK87_9ACTN
MSRTVLPRTAPSPALRGRIGAGFSPVPHRYHLYLSAGCPRSLQVSAELGLLGITDSVAATVLGAAPEGPGHTALRLAYEATGHHFDGTPDVPALVDTWSGRVVSNHTPDILDDLRFLGAHPAFRPGVQAEA